MFHVEQNGQRLDIVRAPHQKPAARGHAHPITSFSNAEPREDLAEEFVCRESSGDFAERLVSLS